MARTTIERRRCRVTRLVVLAMAMAAAVAPRAGAHQPPRVPIADLSRRIAAHPDSVPLLLLRGELRRIEGDLAGARADFARVERLRPNLDRLPLAQAELALDEREPAAALALLERAFPAPQAEADALRLRARAHVALGEPRAAVGDLSDLIARSAKPHPDHFLERARLQISLGEPDQARAGLDEARARLGSTVSLELLAIELELEARSPQTARARLHALQAQYADPEPLEGLASRIESASGSQVPEPDADGPSPETQPSQAPSRAGPAGRDPRSGHRPAGASAVQAIVSRGPYLQVGTPTAITVRWRTDVASDSRVRFGTSPASLTSSASDATLTTEHEVRLTGLLPGTRYYYSVGTAAGPIAGDASFTFRTSPAPGAPTDVRIWAIGDSGEPSPEAFAVRDAYAAWSGSRGTDVWLMLGDNAYSSGEDEQYQEAVFQQYPTMLRQCVLWPTRGNHDALRSGANNDYYEIFTMPTAGEAGGLPSGTEAYYSYNWADIHFICLDSEGSSRSPGSAMLTWLANDLAANTKKWVIAYWHHPPYSKGSHDSDPPGKMRDMRLNVLPILEAGGVDLVLGGHSHCYERSFLLDGHYGTSGSLVPSMIVDGGDGRPAGDGAYIKNVTGSVAHKGAVYSVAGSSSKTSGGKLNHPVMVTSLDLVGSLVVDIHGDVLEGRFLHSNGAVLDSFNIQKPGTLDVPGGPGGAGVAPGVRLGPGLPNPFTFDLHLGYSLASSGVVSLEVHDLTGRRVVRLEDGWRQAGPHDVRWDGLDSLGRPVPDGLYIVVLKALGQTVSRKVSHVR